MRHEFHGLLHFVKIMTYLIYLKLEKKTGGKNGKGAGLGIAFPRDSLENGNVNLKGASEKFVSSSFLHSNASRSMKIPQN